ncbi:MAG: FAD-dependent oxidoreductase [Clostridia bacterium]|nr:FAD-dependent oxidoreductase [Clostridia bacterium]
MSIESMTAKKWDLVVVGGGLTGVAAAVSACRQGMDVLLVEKTGFLGGAPATCLINPFMPYGTRTENGKFALSQGFFSELQRLLRDVGGYSGGSESITEEIGEELHEEYVKLALDRLVTREGVQPLFHAYLCGVEKEGNTLKAVKVATKRGVLRFEAKYFIDCTGDADLAVQADCPFRLGREDGLCQPMTLCFRIGNIDIPTFDRHRPMMQQLYKKLQAEGKIQNPRENVLIFYTKVDGMLHFNTTRVVMLDPTNPFDVTKAEITAREQMFEMYHFLRDNIPGCEKCQLLYSAGEIGVRESRMIDGEYVLNQDDLINCVRFDDRIAAGNYDIDIHNPEGTGTSHYYFKPGTWYTIPYRSLIPRGVSNLLVAGRCISTTHEAQASIRIMPIVTTLGHAAGVAIGLANKAGVGVKEVDVAQLQKQLEAEGAFLG